MTNSPATNSPLTNDVVATTFESPYELLGAVGQNLGTTGWLTLDRDALAQFADATWSAAPAQSDDVPPFMILSLTNLFMPQLLEVHGTSSGVNYGTGTVRFGTTARPGDKLRARASITGAAEVAGGVQTTVEITVEIDGASEPACVVESLSRWML